MIIREVVNLKKSLFFPNLGSEVWTTQKQSMQWDGQFF